MANWYYYNDKREKIGPFEGKVLKQLAQQGIVTPETFIEDPTGRTGLAKNVKGLKFTDTSPVSENPSTIAVPLPPNQPIPVSSPVPKQFFCTNCGNTVAEMAEACMACGAEPTEHKKFCRQCGVALNPEQVVCIKCGTKITTDKEQLFEFLVGEGGEFIFANIMVYASIVLAFISFCLPWAGAVIPFTGQVSVSGFYILYMGITASSSLWESLAYLSSAALIVFGFGMSGFMASIGVGTLNKIEGLRYIEKLLGKFLMAGRPVSVFGALPALGGPLLVLLMFHDPPNVRNEVWLGSGGYVFFAACCLLAWGTMPAPLSSPDQLEQPPSEKENC